MRMGYAVFARIRPLFLLRDQAMNAPYKFPVAIVGAGICGLTIAQRLRAGGVPVLVLEKSKGLGGRFATRRTEGGIVTVFRGSS